LCELTAKPDLKKREDTYGGGRFKEFQKYRVQGRTTIAASMWADQTVPGIGGGMEGVGEHGRTSSQGRSDVLADRNRKVSRQRDKNNLSGGTRRHLLPTLAV
jgi:hypothetical protein